MYMVKVRSPKLLPSGKGRAWVNYGGPYDSRERAEEVKARAEERQTCDVWGNPVMYKVVKLNLRYQVITYHEDCGADEQCSYPTLKEARDSAKRQLYTTPNTTGTANGSIVYDLKGRCIKEIYGYFPESSRPIEEVQA